MKRHAVFYIVFAGILWGTSGLFSRLLAGYGFSALQSTGVRGIVGFLCILVFSLLREKGAFRVRLSHLPLYIAIGVALFFSAFCYFYAIPLTSPSTAVMLMYTAPVYVSVFSVLFFGERMTGWKLVSVVCIMVGCCFVSGIIGGFKLDALGLFIGALSGVAYATYNILSKLLIRLGASSTSITLYGFMTVMVFSLFAAEPSKIVSHTVKAPLPVILLMLGVGIVTYALPYFFYTLSLRYLPVGTASALSIIEPMAATVLGILFLQDRPNVFSYVGIFLVLGSVVLLSWAEERAGMPKGKETADAKAQDHIA